jgi:hypothetical protein
LLDSMSPIADAPAAVNGPSKSSESMFADTFDNSGDETGYALENSTLSDGMDQDCSLCK